MEEWVVGGEDRMIILQLSLSSLPSHYLPVADWLIGEAAGCLGPGARARAGR